MNIKEVIGYLIQFGGVAAIVWPLPEGALTWHLVIGIVMTAVGGFIIGRETD